MRATPEIVTKVRSIVTYYLFGFYPWSYDNEVDRSILFDRALNTDIDSLTPTATGSFNTSSVYIPIAADFTERRFTYEYFSMQDVIK